MKKLYVTIVKTIELETNDPVFSHLLDEGIEQNEYMEMQEKAMSIVEQMTGYKRFESGMMEYISSIEDAETEDILLEY
jgi:hypothetical protein